MDSIDESLERARINARRYARKFMRYSAFDYDDFYGWACVGVATALKYHDPTRSQFTTFCELKVKHAILDGIREMVGKESAKYRVPHPHQIYPINEEFEGDDCFVRRIAVPPSQLRALIDEDERELIREIVRALPYKMSRIIHMRFWRGMTYAQMGKAMGISESKMLRWIHEAIGEVGRRWYASPYMARRKRAAA